ncbi:MAG: hypothetical protein ACHQ4F_10860 [Candidatus Dormibacteria bacterium]
MVDEHGLEEVAREGERQARQFGHGWTMRNNQRDGSAAYRVELLTPKTADSKSHDLRVVISSVTVKIPSAP